MSEYPHIDSKSLEYLKYIFRNDNCSIRSLFDEFGVKGIDDAQVPISLLLYFVKSGYVALCTPDGRFIDSFCFNSYFDHCVQNSQPVTTPECTLMLLPEGRYIIEEMTRQKRYFNIPVIISLISGAISLASLLFQMFNNSPISVRIIECLTK